MKLVKHERDPMTSGQCGCDECVASAKARGELAKAARDEALRRGLSQSVADRAASYRVDDAHTIEDAIERASKQAEIREPELIYAC